MLLWYMFVGFVVVLAVEAGTGAETVCNGNGSSSPGECAGNCCNCPGFRIPPTMDSDTVTFVLVALGTSCVGVASKEDTGFGTGKGQLRSGVGVRPVPAVGREEGPVLLGTV